MTFVLKVQSGGGRNAVQEEREAPLLQPFKRQLTLVFALQEELSRLLHKPWTGYRLQFDTARCYRDKTLGSWTGILQSVFPVIVDTEILPWRGLPSMTAARRSAAHRLSRTGMSFGWLLFVRQPPQ